MQNTESIVPKEFVKALQNVLDHGVQYFILPSNKFLADVYPP